MYCPNCSEPKANDATQFCKRCGFDLFGLSEFVESGEAGVPRPAANSKRRKGIRQGVRLLAIGLVLIPVWMFIALIFPPDDRLVESSPSTTPAEAIAWIAMWITFIAGALRIAYALVFEDERFDLSGRQAVADEIPAAASLPSADAFHPAEAGRWKTTGELFERVKRRARTSGEL